MVVGLLGLLGALHGPSHAPAAPKFTAVTLKSTSKELQAVCNAQGHLQLLAQYPSDPFTAFDLLDLDPHTRPFSPSRNSHWDGRTWYQELRETVDNRYMKLIEAASRDDEGRGDGHRKRQYKVAVTAASDLLAKDEPRRFYMDIIMPMLEYVVREQPLQCVWPRVRQFHRNLCAATWATTGMMGLLQDDDNLESADSGCFNAADDASGLFGTRGR